MPLPPRRLALRLAAPLLALGLATATPAAAVAQVAPSEALREAARHADRGDWDAALDAAAPAGEVAQDVIRWRSLRDEGEWSFLDYAHFVADHPDWPGLDRLRANGERAVLPGTAPQAVVAFFGDEPPQTGQGARALAEALTALGRPDEAGAVVTDAWLSLRLTSEGQRVLLEAHGDLLAPHHAARTDAMLWRGRTEDAERMLPLLGDERRALARARLSRIRGGEPSLGDLPAALRGDPGLAYDRFARLVADGDFTEAASLVAPRSASAEALGEPFRWGAGRAQIARWMMREGRHADAYRMASRHHMAEGDAFADLEWLAGYLSLRFLNEPERARDHFRRSEAAVTGPISVSRAAYWTGRAEAALGRPEEAQAAFARAGRHQTAFYGLLGAEAAGLPLDPTLTGREDFGDWQGADSALTGDVARAMLMLFAAGEREDALLFALHLARTLDRRGVGQLGLFLESLEEPYVAVLAGKAAAERGVVIPSAYFPLHPLADGDWPVTADLALSIARRESEFNAGVASPVGAQGLMQVMPATAREVAGWLGVPYSRDRLVEWEYNAALGTRYLQMLEEQFGTSPVLIAAGYNAGPGRPRQWMAARGDLRRAEVDVVDWIEHIPFAETRTYVMRVAESIPVYRARLAGRTSAAPLAFTALLRGVPPHVRPVARPREVEVATLAPPAAQAPAQAPPAPPAARLSTSGVSAAVAARVPEPAPFRPLARPEPEAAARPEARPDIRPAAES